MKRNRNAFHLSFSLILPAMLIAYAMNSHALAQKGLSESNEANLQRSNLDVRVTDQDGKQLNFYRDLIKNKTVAINFIFTTCTTICPPLGATFARVQKELGEHVGRDIFFISITVDPQTDTPERLKAWGARFQSGPAWRFITGQKAELDRILAAFSVGVARKEDHSPTVIILNDKTGVQTRAYGLASPHKLADMIKEAAGTAP